jgi:hypothetical protein
VKKLFGCLLILFNGFVLAVLAAAALLLILLDVPMRFP